MTKQQFIERYRYELGGIVMDAATHCRQSGELAIWTRRMFERHDRMLERMFDELCPAPLAGVKAPSANGVHKPTPAKT